MKRFRLFLSVFVLALLSTCAPGKTEKVVVYTSVDQVFAEPVFAEFTRQTGIEVLPVFDVEASKTTGLVNRLIAEAKNPQADLFWSSEFARMLLLKEKGVLIPSYPANAGDIPAAYRDPENYWYGFGGRARVIIVNTDWVSPENYPAGYMDFLNPDYPADKIGMANPLFGTTSNEAAALYAAMGEEAARKFYSQIKERGVQILDGNSVVRDQVAAGQLWFGLTDTDDACGALEQGAPVTLIFIEQDPSHAGTLMIPNTAALIKGRPHSDAALRLLEYLLSEQVEQQLAALGFAHVPLHSALPADGCLAGKEIIGSEIRFDDIYQWLKPAQEDLKTIFLK